MNSGGACYLLQYKDSIDKASPDSIEKYGYSPFQSFNPIYIDDAMEMLKSSSLISAIENKKTCYPDYSNIQHDKKPLMAVLGLLWI